MAKDVIVLEFNELTPALVDRFCSEGHLPNFSRLRDRSIVAVTDAEAQFPHLEPWIQWVTVHTGLSHREHGVFDLSDGPALKAPRIWDLVSEEGEKVWICGSMNAAVRGKNINGFLLPDPWATDIEAYPRGYFAAYNGLVQPYVQEYTAEKPPVGIGAMLSFARFMAANGLSTQTVANIARQLAGELRNPIKWKRALILDRLQWDVFRCIYKRERPKFSTFFLNSTAHFQHYYWRNMEPDLFASKSAPEVQRTYADAVLAGYRQMDRLIGECMAMAGPETAIVLCTALGQRPMLDYEETGGKQIFKVRDIDALCAFAGVSGHEYAPVMAEQFYLFFRTEAEAADAERKFQALRLDDGTPLMLARREGTRLFAGCSLVTAPHPDAAMLAGQSNASIPFLSLFYPVEAVRSGMHDPKGILWIALPERRHLQVEREVSLLEIAPTLLEIADVRTAHAFDRSAMPEIGTGATGGLASPIGQARGKAGHAA